MGKRKNGITSKFLESNKDIKMVYSNFYLLDQSKGEKISRHNNQLPSGRITGQLLKNYTIGILTVCAHKKIFEKYFLKQNIM